MNRREEILKLLDEAIILSKKDDIASDIIQKLFKIKELF